MPLSQKPLPQDSTVCHRVRVSAKEITATAEWVTDFNNLPAPAFDRQMCASLFWLGNERKFMKQPSLGNCNTTNQTVIRWVEAQAHQISAAHFSRQLVPQGQRRNLSSNVSCWWRGCRRFQNGGTGVPPVKSGVPLDFVRDGHREKNIGCGEHVSSEVLGGTPKTTGQRPVPPRRF